MSYGGADLSTYDPNPSMDDYASTTPGIDYTSIINTAGQWGATITALATGQGPTQQPTVVYATGAPASGFTSQKTSQILIIVVIVGALFFLLKKD